MQEARRLAPATVAALVLTIGVPIDAVGGQRPPEGGLVGLASRAEGLERELELASGEAFYLVLDREEAVLRLMLKGALLQRYPFVHEALRVPRVAFVRREVPEGWDRRIWTGGTLDPVRPLDRMEIVADAAKAGEAPPVIPPLPEEAIAVPRSFRIRFADGMSVEVQSELDAGGVAGWTHALMARARDAFGVLVGREADRLRLRLTLPREAAESLYRSLPPETSLMMLPPPLPDPARSE